MKYGTHIYLLTDRWSDEQLPLLDLARELGLDMLELSVGDDVHFTPRLTRDRASALGIDLLVGPGGAWPYACDLSADDPSDRARGLDWHRRVVDLAAETGRARLCGGAVWPSRSGEAPAAAGRRIPVDRRRAPCPRRACRPGGSSSRPGTDEPLPDAHGEHAGAAAQAHPDGRPSQPPHAVRHLSRGHGDQRLRARRSGPSAACSTPSTPARTTAASRATASSPGNRYSRRYTGSGSRGTSDWRDTTLRSATSRWSAACSTMSVRTDRPSSGPASVSCEAWRRAPAPESDRASAPPAPPHHPRA